MGDVGEISGVQLLGLGGDRVRAFLEHVEDVRGQQRTYRPLVILFDLRSVGGRFHGASGSVRRSDLESVTS